MPDDSTSGTKALIKVLKGKPPELDTDEIPIRFYPTEYSLDKSATYGEQNLPGLTSPITQFVSGSAASLSMELLFDTYEQRKDVREEYTNKIDALLEATGELHAPPILQIVWGGLTEFKWVLESANKRFTMFLQGGTPVRATVTVSFKQYEPPGTEGRKRPKESADRTKVRRVTEGDTLWLIASKEYGNPGAWRPIAKANGIENPRTLQGGSELVLPPLEP